MFVLNTSSLESSCSRSIPFYYTAHILKCIAFVTLSDQKVVALYKLYCHPFRKKNCQKKIADSRLRLKLSHLFVTRILILLKLQVIIQPSSTVPSIFFRHNSNLLVSEEELDEQLVWWEKLLHEFWFSN